MPTAAPRVDLFTMIHKGLRALLFQAAAEASRLDVTSAAEVDALVARLESTLAFLDEHAAHEDRHVLPALRTVAPGLAAALASDHRVLDALQLEVELGTEALLAATPAVRPAVAAELARHVLRLTAAHLAHMGREETEGNQALWDALDDGELVAIRGRITGSIGPERHAAWMDMIRPALTPFEQSLIAGPPRAQVVG